MLISYLFGQHVGFLVLVTLKIGRLYAHATKAVAVMVKLFSMHDWSYRYH